MTAGHRVGVWRAVLVIALAGVAAGGCVTRTPTPARSAGTEPSLASELPSLSGEPLPGPTAAGSPSTTTAAVGTATAAAGTTAASGTVRATTAAPPPRVPSAADLRRALLNGGDLAGFGPGDGGETPDGAGGCAAIDSDYSGGASATAQVLLSKGSAGPFIRERLNQLSVQAAQNAVSRIRGASSCGSFTTDLPGLGKIDVQATALGVPGPGDDAGGVRLTMRPRGIDVTVYENIVAVRRGGTLILLTHTSVGSVDDALTSTAASRAYDKTKQVW